MKNKEKGEEGHCEYLGGFQDIQLFIPDKELVDFATFFSERYKTIGSGSYSSSKQTYLLNYVDGLANDLTQEPLCTPSRLWIKTGHIDVSKERLMSEKYTSDFVFYMIIWCVIKRNIQSFIETDIRALDYYLTTGRSKENLLMGLTESLSSPNMTEQQKERLALANRLILGKVQSVSENPYDMVLSVLCKSGLSMTEERIAKELSGKLAHQILWKLLEKLKKDSHVACSAGNWQIRESGRVFFEEGGYSKLNG